MAGLSGLTGPGGLGGPYGMAGLSGLTGPGGLGGPYGMAGLSGLTGPGGLGGPYGMAGPEGLEGPDGLEGANRSGLLSGRPIGDTGPGVQRGPGGPDGPGGPVSREGRSGRRGNMAGKSRASDAVTQPHKPALRLKDGYPYGSRNDLPEGRRSPPRRTCSNRHERDYGVHHVIPYQL